MRHDLLVVLSMVMRLLTGIRVSWQRTDWLALPCCCVLPCVLRHGRATFSVLLFQDLAVVVLLMLIPLLAPDPSGASSGGMAKIATVSTHDTLPAQNRVCP